MSGERVVVVAGGELNKMDIQRISPQDTIIAVDGGARQLLQMGIYPTSVVGDFDTLDGEYLSRLQQMDIAIDQLPMEKDMTDTQFALDQACKMGADELILLGFCGGGRIDHAIANLYLMESLLKQNKKATLYFLHNRLRIYKGPARIVVTKEEEFQYLSLIPISEQLRGVSYRGLKYSLTDATLYRADSRGISNEITEDQAEIRFSEGTCFLIESNDQ